MSFTELLTNATQHSTAQPNTIHLFALLPNWLLFFFFRDTFFWLVLIHNDNLLMLPLPLLSSCHLFHVVAALRFRSYASGVFTVCFGSAFEK